MQYVSATLCLLSQPEARLVTPDQTGFSFWSAHMPDHELAEVIETAIERALGRHAQCTHANCPFGSDDLVFVQTWRQRIEKFATAIGLTVIAAVLGAVGFLIQLGVEAWKKL